MFLFQRTNKKWYVGYYIGKKRVNRSLKTCNKAVANERFREFKADNKTVRISDMMRKALEYAGINTSLKTQSAYRLCLTRFKDYLKDEKLANISETDIKNYIGWRNGNKYSMNIEIAILKTSFKIACDKDWIIKNPAKNIKKFEPKSPVKDFTAEEKTAFLNELKQCGNINYYYATVLAFETGMRKAEICNLKWSQIINNEKILLGNKMDEEPEYAYVSAKALEVLSELKAAKVRSLDDYVFGHPLQQRNLTRTFNRIRAKLGLDKYIRFHSTRHTAITKWANKMPLHVAQKLARHRDIKTTMKYVHTDEQQLKDAVNK